MFNNFLTTKLITYEHVGTVLNNKVALLFTSYEYLLSLLVSLYVSSSSDYNTKIIELINDMDTAQDETEIVET